jgi:predicted DNA-binding helix-hairpin-helix protein
MHRALARVLIADFFDYFHLRRNYFQAFAPVLADPAQRRMAIRAGLILTRYVMLDGLAR